MGRGGGPSAPGGGSTPGEIIQEGSTPPLEGEHMGDHSVEDDPMVVQKDSEQSAPSQHISELRLPGLSGSQMHKGLACFGGVDMVVVEADLKVALGYRHKQGHRTWRKFKVCGIGS